MAGNATTFAVNTANFTTDMGTYYTLFSESSNWVSVKAKPFTVAPLARTWATASELLRGKVNLRVKVVMQTGARYSLGGGEYYLDVPQGLSCRLAFLEIIELAYTSVFVKNDGKRLVNYNHVTLVEIFSSDGVALVRFNGSVLALIDNGIDSVEFGEEETVDTKESPLQQIRRRCQCGLPLDDDSIELKYKDQLDAINRAVRRVTIRHTDRFYDETPTATTGTVE